MAAAATDATGEVRVWDPLVRVLHWSLVVAVALAWLTAEEHERAHAMIGYAVLGIVAVRTLWGFIGTQHARFADFVRPPRAVLAYARAIVTGTAPRFLGHNPIGGWMILALLFALVVTAGTGWLAQAAAGPRAHLFEEAHEAAANALLVLIGVHIVGVLAESVRAGENLVRAMITGRKRTTALR